MWLLIGLKKGRMKKEATRCAQGDYACASVVENCILGVLPVLQRGVLVADGILCLAISIAPVHGFNNGGVGHQQARLPPAVLTFQLFRINYAGPRDQ